MHAGLGCVWESQFHSQYRRLPLSHRWGRAPQNYSFVFWVFFIGFGATSSGTQGFLLAPRSGIAPGRPRDPTGYRASNPDQPPARQTPSPLCHHSWPQNDIFIGERQRRAVAIHVFLRPSTVSSHQLPLCFLPSAVHFFSMFHFLLVPEKTFNLLNICCLERHHFPGPLVASLFVLSGVCLVCFLRSQLGLQRFLLSNVRPPPSPAPSPPCFILGHSFAVFTKYQVFFDNFGAHVFGGQKVERNQS